MKRVLDFMFVTYVTSVILFVIVVAVVVEPVVSDYACTVVFPLRRFCRGIDFRN